MYCKFDHSEMIFGPFEKMTFFGEHPLAKLISSPSRVRKLIETLFGIGTIQLLTLLLLCRHVKGKPTSLIKEATMKVKEKELNPKAKDNLTGKSTRPTKAQVAIEAQVEKDAKLDTILEKEGKFDPFKVREPKAYGNNSGSSEYSGLDDDSSECLRWRRRKRKQRRRKWCYAIQFKILVILCPLLDGRHV